MVMVTRLYGNVGLLVLAGAVGVTDIDPFILSLISRTADLQTMLLTAVAGGNDEQHYGEGHLLRFPGEAGTDGDALALRSLAALHLPVILIG